MKNFGFSEGPSLGFPIQEAAMAITTMPWVTALEFDKSVRTFGFYAGVSGVL